MHHSLIRSWLRGLIYLNAAIALSYVALVFVAGQQGLLWRGDFTAYFTGAMMVREGHASQLYDFALQAEVQREMLGERSFYGGLLPFISPPHVALLLLPLAVLPLPAAFAVWTVGGLLGLMWLVRLLYHATRAWAPVHRWLLVSVVVALPAVMRTLLQGTSSIWACIGLLLVLRALRSPDDAAAAGGWALGSIRPQAFVPAGLFALLQRRWRLVIVALAVALVVFGVASAVCGVHIWADFLANTSWVGRMVDEYGVYPEEMINFRGTLTRYLGEQRSAVITAVSRYGFLLSVVVMVALWLRPLKPGAPQWGRRLALGLAVGHYFSMHLNPHDGLLLALPLLLLAADPQIGAPSRPALVLGIGLLPLALLVCDFLLVRWLPVRGSVLLAWALIVWACVLIWRRGEDTTPASSGEGR